MNVMRIALALLLSGQTFLTAGEEPSALEAPAVNKLQILYLLQKKELTSALDLYETYRQKLGRHDFEVLQDMGLLILDQGMRSFDSKNQLLSIFGAHLAGVIASIDILESGIKSPFPENQLAAIQFLGRLQDDRSEALLTKAMASEFLFTRMAAAEQLSIRKSRSAVGQIEALMYRIPPQVRFFFPPFFAVIGTQDAISVLKHLMDEPFDMTRIEAILSVARLQRDDLLPKVRAAATHTSPAEQEACATALGLLKDSKSIPLLQKLSNSSVEPIQVAALRSLYLLGDLSAKTRLEELAIQEDLFAITAIGPMSESEKTLLKLSSSPNIQVRLNAAVALLEQRNPKVTPLLKEFILSDFRDLKLEIHYSPGHSLSSWRVFTTTRSKEQLPYDPEALSLHLKEQLLSKAIELPKEAFLSLAEAVFQTKQNALIPLTVSLLENIHTEEAIQLLEKYSKAQGEPLMRTYCQLALFRMKKGTKTPIVNWIKIQKKEEMVRFRPSLPWENTAYHPGHSLELTPEEHSRLLIECYQTLTLEHTEEGIDLILDSLKTGHPQNLAILAGLLIQTLQ